MAKKTVESIKIYPAKSKCILIAQKIWVEHLVKHKIIFA